MSLDLKKLEKVRQLPDGSAQARCPACAEDGRDRSGEHLHIYADGRFGCCVGRDREHRRRIYALAKGKEAGRIQVKVKVASAANPPQSIRESLMNFVGVTADVIATEQMVGTPGTGNSESRACAKGTGADDKRPKETETGVPAVPAASWLESIEPFESAKWAEGLTPEQAEKRARAIAHYYELKEKAA